MSTNEENKTQETNQNGSQIPKTNNHLGNITLNSIESDKNTSEGNKVDNGVSTTILKNDDPDSRSNSTLEKATVDHGESNQTLQGDNTVLEDSSTGEEISENPDMSRINIPKSRLPNKTLSRSALPHSSTKVPGELSGQPSLKNTKEDIKYWKNREQELLSKIAELEFKVSEKDKIQGSLDSVAKQIQEKLENDLVATTKEKENYKNRLQTIEKELYSKQKEISSDPNLKNLKNSDEIINHLKIQNEDLRNALAKMTAILRDKTTMCISQEKKIAALMNQVESLKEVVAITKDLLNIRNMEVQHLSNDISAMETKIDCERQRHNQMLIKMDEAVKLNGDLKKEYENQLRLFQHLRDSYEEKILLLSRDDKIERKQDTQTEKKYSNEESSNSQA